MQFADVDQAGVVHLPCLLRYLEEAEQAWWRAAGLSIADSTSGVGWPRVAVAFEFRRPLRFEEEVEVRVRLEQVGARSLRYGHTVVRGATVIGIGTITTVSVQPGADGMLKPVPVPAGVVERLQSLLLQ